MLETRLLLGLVSIATCGVVYAAISPAVQERVTPAAEHQRLQSAVGSFEGTISMGDEKMPCTEVVSSVGEFWTTTRFEMDYMGTPFVGSGTTGYDPEKGKYIGTWIDSMNPSMTLQEGSWDEAKTAIVMYYEVPDEVTGEMKKVRSENVQTAYGYTVKFFDVEGDKLTMEMAMKRSAGTRAVGVNR